MIDRDPATTPWSENLKDTVTITKGFEKEIPFYVSEFLGLHLEEIRLAAMHGERDKITEILIEFAKSIPKETSTSSFKELFLGIFFPDEGKPHLSIIEGGRERIDSTKVSDSDLDFPEAPISTTGIILIHTHPHDSEIGLSEPDVEAFSGIFSQRLRLFPKLKHASIGLCTAGKPDKTLLFEADNWSGMKYFSREKLRNRG